MVWDDDSYIEFAVEDSGPGIPIEKREHLFNKYQESLGRIGTGNGTCFHSIYISEVRKIY